MSEIPSKVWDFEDNILQFLPPPLGCTYSTVCRSPILLPVSLAWHFPGLFYDYRILITILCKIIHFKLIQLSCLVLKTVSDIKVICWIIVDRRGTSLWQMCGRCWRWDRTTYPFCLPVHPSFIEKAVKTCILQEEPELLFQICHPKPRVTWALVLVVCQSFKSQALRQVIGLWGFQYQSSSVNADRVTSSTALAMVILVAWYR